MKACRYLFALTILLNTGCSEEPAAIIEAPPLTFDTVSCLGDIRDSAATDCRSSLGAGLPAPPDAWRRQRRIFFFEIIPGARGRFL